MILKNFVLKTLEVKEIRGLKYIHEIYMKLYENIYIFSIYENI